MKIELEKDFLAHINTLGLGEYTQQMIEKAQNYAVKQIEEPEENLDAVATIMLDYLNGAAEMLKTKKK